MSYTVIYENNRGERINLTQSPYLLNIEPITDYGWNYATKDRRRGSIIAGFSKGITSRDLTLHIYGETEDDRNIAIDKFNDVIESDIYDGTIGKIWMVNEAAPDDNISDWLQKKGWYTYGYIISSENTKWQYGVPIIKKVVNIVREQDLWFHPTIKKNNKGGEGSQEDVIAEEYAKGYENSYDFGYDYIRDLSTVADITNQSVLGSDFIVTIQGEADRPQIQIGQTVIHINEVIPEGAFLVVDSTARTITMTIADGTQINMFGARDPDYYIFRPIDAGRNVVTWNGSFAWEIQLLTARSEPAWHTV